MITDHFPFSSYRKHQDFVLTQIEDYWESYDHFILEAPTGFGKSPVAYATARWLYNEHSELSHILVADKYLQEQYLSYDGVEIVKGRNNFLCSIPSPYLTEFGREAHQVTCDMGPCTIIPNFVCPYKPRVELDEVGVARDEFGVIYTFEETATPPCPYMVQKHKAIRSPITIHNYHYFLYEMNLGGRGFSHRKLGVLDEAHAIENILMDFVQEYVSLRRLNRIFDYFGYAALMNIPDINTVDDWAKWVGEIRERLEEVTHSKLYTSLRRVKEITLRDARVFTLLNTYLNRLNVLKIELNVNPDNWVWERNERAVVFKPVLVDKYVRRNLLKHVDKTIMMSATILDHEVFCRYLGIDKGDVKFIRIGESNFPVDNRPLIQDYQGKATYKRMDSYLPKVLQRLDEHYIPTHLEEKGVIHTHTNKIADYILRNSRYRAYMMSNVGNEESREDVFQEFFDKDPPCIMVTPSMRMGIDLHGDRCRWQVIVKVPFPSLGDPQIRKRVDLDQRWYDWQTLISLIQTYGRGCRSEDDYCETYILDQVFPVLVRRNERILPRWFLTAIKRSTYVPLGTKNRIIRSAVQ